MQSLCLLVFSELLKLRNTLVHHVQRCVRKEAEHSRLSPLPDILTDRQTCRYCPQSFNCALYERWVWKEPRRRCKQPGGRR